jgi:hypothetical protein
MDERILVVLGQEDGEEIEYETTSIIEAKIIMEVLKSQWVQNLIILEYDTIEKVYHIIND